MTTSAVTIDLGLADIPKAISTVGEIVLEAITKDQYQLIEDERRKAVKDCETFKAALLKNDTDFINLMLNGLRESIDINYSENESKQLESGNVNIDKLTFCSYYQRARCADFLAKKLDIILTKK